MSNDTTAADPELARQMDRAHLKSVATLHFVMVMGALTLWGAADAWAEASGWALAHAAALANAVIAGLVIANTLHEWGHFAGARLSGSASPVMEKPVKYFFMFNFPFEQNDSRQFAWMSWGGILTPWLLVLLVALLVPIDTASRALLLAVFVTRAVQVSVFEVPVVQRASRGGDPREELGRQLEAGFATSRYVGLAVGALVWIVAG
ncbi:MAG: hypothetical protein QNK04_33620 [Myxococcota bacterium]|nr:hypothetical protein [Myxococcota bacterium]